MVITDTGNKKFESAFMGLQAVNNLKSGEWVHTPILGKSALENVMDSLDVDIEQRVLGVQGLNILGGGLMRPPISRYHLEQEFEGVVLDVDIEARTFFARLVDETECGAPDEEALFSFDEISLDDIDLIVPGALFSWIMGRTERNRIIVRSSEIRFRRVFKFSELAITRAQDSAAELFALLTDEV
jgi:hypothetical protein